MRANKPGLADLKRLRLQSLDVDKPSAARPAQNVAGAKRKKKAAEAALANKVAMPAQPPSNTDNAVATQAVSLLASSDRALFRLAVKSVQRLPASNRALLPPVPVAPRHVLRQRRESAAGAEPVALPQVSDQYAPHSTDSDPTRFLQAGHGPDLLKNLAQGKWPIGASLDLHGATLDDARQRLDSFLRSCIEHKIRCVRVVHGKGYGSKNGTSVLKETIRRWLTQFEDVMAFVECSERDGGAGAVLVLLRPLDT